MKSVDYLLPVDNDENSLGISIQSERLLIIQAIRVVLLSFILLVALIFQSTQPDFLNPDVWIPIFLILSVGFLINTSMLVIFTKLFTHWSVNALTFSFDVLLVTSLIHYTGVNQSVFLFLYLIYIIMCGLVYGRKGALLMALWTSTCFSGLLIFSANSLGRNIYFAVALNNFAFFAVAFLSGYLSEQIDFIGGALKSKGKELEVLRDFNQLIVNSVGTGFLTLDNNMEITHQNLAAENILSESLLTGKKLIEVFPELNQQIIDNSLSLNKKALRYEQGFENFKNENLLLETMTSQLKDTDDELIGYVIMFQDQTEIKRMEFQLRQQDKMAAVGQLAAGIAHEIRNPLASISGSVQLLDGSSSLSTDENSRLMKIVLREIDRLNNLISEFLDFVRPENMTQDPVNLNALLEDVLEMILLNENLRKDIKQTIELQCQRMILGNYDKLKQALLNIIINAYQAMEKVDTANLSVSTFDRGDFVMLVIKDSGSGMDENNIRRLFEPFHTTKSKGTGLGLAVTHRIIENHGANIFVESELGKGTTFTIEFPAGDGYLEDDRAKVYA